MRIAINAADLDHPRIDGTRIYIQNLLKNFGRLDKQSRFLIFHRSEFNPDLKFPAFENYEIIRKPFPFWWTQTRFAREILKEKPAVLFMPMHSLPFFRPRKTKTVVTIHDLAFKFFPDHFPKKDLRRLNFFTDFAVRNADRLIAISQSTKNDILKLYPGIEKEKIKVIYHGYDADLFNESASQKEINRVKTRYKIPFDKYLIHIGVVRPRKNIETLIEAFRRLKKDPRHENIGLVLAGRIDYEGIRSEIGKTKDVAVTGMYATEDLPALIRGAEIFAFPSLYEGFGIPIIESMACGTPVIAAKNSSLEEIVKTSGLLFEAKNAEQLADALRKILENGELRKDLSEKGLERARMFSWEKCARETLDWLKT